MGIRQSIANLIDKSDMTDVTNLYRVFFRMFLSTVMIFGGFAFLWEAAFTPEAEITEVTLLIVGFVVGTFLALPIGFYFGGQDRQKKNEKEEAPPQ